MGWEYKTIEKSMVREVAVGEVREDTGVPLGDLGADGWELVGIVGDKLVFKRNDGTTFEKARGEGMGQGGPRQGDGGASVCVCPNCGETIAHERGTPCANIVCPKCGTQMVGKEEEKARGWRGRREIVCTECGYVMERPPGEPLVSIVCPACGSEGFEFVKTVLPKEDRESLLKHLDIIEGQIDTLEGVAEGIRLVLKRCGGGTPKKKRKSEVGNKEGNPLESIHACMTCDDFSVERISQKEQAVGGTCNWKGWATNGMSDCPGWVPKGTPQAEKDRIRSALKEEGSDGAGSKPDRG